jgi:CTP:molybdopterin cytidylyltransferase MocA
MGASLRAGLTAVAGRPEVEAVLVTLVDLPDVCPVVIALVLNPSPTPPSPNGPFEVERVGTPTGSVTNDQFDVDGRGAPGWRAELRRAAYGGVRGHPALIGRDLWDEVVATAVGDQGAREVYRTHPHVLVECGDLATGRDVDTRAELDRSLDRPLDRSTAHLDRSTRRRPSEGPPFRDRAR